MKEKHTIAIVGNPNSGKTTVFNELTGGRQRVGNWPGVTVEKLVGTYVYGRESYEVIDLPGIYSLSSSSLDEQIAREYILDESPNLVVNIVDAAHLERNLYLTVQLLEMRVPMLIVLNMMDRVKQKKMTIAIETLATLLDCPVVCTVAKRGDGIDNVKSAVVDAVHKQHVSSAKVHFPEEVENAIEMVMRSFSTCCGAADAYDARWTAIKALENDLPAAVKKCAFKILDDLVKERKSIESIIGEDADIVIADSRYGFINAVCKQVISRKLVARKNVSDAIDKIVLNSFLGVPVFLVAMYLTFWLTINFGGCFIDFFDLFVGAVCVDAFGGFLQMLHVPEFLVILLADGVGGGIQTVATFIPPISCMFLCLAFLEDSGYMSRAAFIMDRFMRKIGLPGKAFVPMLVGFGCNVPAIMATRTLERQKDRVMTILMNPFMSCGARMPVYALFAAAFFPQSGGTIVFVLYLTGIMLAIATAYILKYTILQGEASTFIMELPPYHLPTVKGLLIHTWHRLSGFVVRAGQAIIVVVVLLTILSAVGMGRGVVDRAEDSLLSGIGKAVVPIFEPMGMREDNWPAAVGIFTGIFAKEAVLGTLDALYPVIDAYQEDAVEDEVSIVETMGDAFRTIPENLSALSLPFSLTGLLGADVDGAVEELEVDDRIFASMHRHFDGKVGAFAYLLMILLYMPCVAAIAAVYKELGLGWTIFSAGYLSGLAWIVSTLFYQGATMLQHPATSLAWIAVCIVAVLVFIAALKRRGPIQIEG